jgi:hypothetical protein
MRKLPVICLMLLMLLFIGTSTLSKTEASVEPSTKPEIIAKTSANCSWFQAFTYYTDASHTTVCGARVYFCDGEVGQGGTVTQYFSVRYCDCIEE